MGMQSLSPAFSQSLILFMLIAAGFAAGRMGVLRPDSTRALSRFLVDFTLPAVIVMSMQRPFSPELRDQALRILLVSSTVYALSFPVAYALTLAYRRAGRAELGVHRFALCFSNVAFMGFPVAEALLGKESLFILSIYNIPFQLLAFSVGVVLIAGRDPAAASGKAAAGVTDASTAPTAPLARLGVRLAAAARLLLNPAVASALVGFGLFLGSVTIPQPIAPALDLLGGMTTPLAMVVIGAVLSQTRLSGVVANPRLWVTSFHRLASLPLLLYAGARAAGLAGLELAVPVLAAAMPVAANSTILAGVYGGDEVTASGLVFATTALSLATIPLIARLL